MTGLTTQSALHGSAGTLGQLGVWVQKGCREAVEVSALSAQQGSKDDFQRIEQACVGSLNEITSQAK
jgi:hypothetical protein